MLHHSSDETAPFLGRGAAEKGGLELIATGPLQQLEFMHQMEDF